MIICAVVIKLIKREKFNLKGILLIDLAFAGVFQTASTYCAIEMSFKIDYLFKTLFRSSKFISLLFGAMMFKSDGHEHLSKNDLFWGAILTIGVFVFNLGNPSK